MLSPFPPFRSHRSPRPRSLCRRGRRAIAGLAALGLAAIAGLAPPAAAQPDPTRILVRDGGRSLQLQRDGETLDLDVTGWNLAVLDGFDCAALETEPALDMSAQRIVGEPALDPDTGRVAVAVLLQECAEVQQTAVFVLDPQPGAVALYRVQLPGDRPFPHEFSSYAFSSISGLGFWDGHLLVRHGDVAGNEALAVFAPGRTPAGTYAGCIELRDGEGPGLCPEAR